MTSLHWYSARNATDVLRNKQRIVSGTYALSHKTLPGLLMTLRPRENNCGVNERTALDRCSIDPSLSFKV